MSQRDNACMLSLGCGALFNLVACCSPSACKSHQADHAHARLDKQKGPGCEYPCTPRLRACNTCRNCMQLAPLHRVWGLCTRAQDSPGRRGPPGMPVSRSWGTRGAGISSMLCSQAHCKGCVKGAPHMHPCPCAHGTNRWFDKSIDTPTRIRPAHVLSAPTRPLPPTTPCLALDASSPPPPPSPPLAHPQSHKHHHHCHPFTSALNAPLLPPLRPTTLASPWAAPPPRSRWVCPGTASPRPTAAPMRG